MVSKEEFTSHVADAYEHLYDLVYLRTHPLADILISPASPTVKKRARELHDLLRDLIDELDPGPQAPSFSPEWRRHRYMVLRYLKGLAHQAVADQFRIGLRQYYRVRKAIIDDVASILWDRYVVHRPVPEDAQGAIEDEAPSSRLELLRLEGARLAQADRYARIGEVAKGVLSLLQGVLRQRELDVNLALPASLPAVSVQRGLLRQTLVGILGYLVERAEQATVRLTTQVEGATVFLSLTVEPSEVVCGTGRNQDEERLAELKEMAVLSNCHILPIYDGQFILGFELHLPVARRTVLIVDDNEDVLQLFRGYLSSQGYRVITARTAREAIDKAHQFQPYAITLDLMMPERDGWELLQVLLARPDTCDIPIIVCTVLKQKELALSLGATAYLEKPVTKQTLLSALQALEET